MFFSLFKFKVRLDLNLQRNINPDPSTSAAYILFKLFAVWKVILRRFLSDCLAVRNCTVGEKTAGDNFIIKAFLSKNSNRSLVIKTKQKQGNVHKHGFCLQKPWDSHNASVNQLVLHNKRLWRNLKTAAQYTVTVNNIRVYRCKVDQFQSFKITRLSYARNDMSKSWQRPAEVWDMKFPCFLRVYYNT